MKINNWNLAIKENLMLKSGINILEKIKSIFPESESFIVGGTVRDLILGNDIKDIDISTNVDVNILESFFNCHDIGKNKEFGIIVVSHNDFNFEIANYRSDGAYSDGRHPDSVKIINSFEEDVKRRDFTCNALGIDLEGNIIDYVDGIGDISNKLLRAVGAPVMRFKEDYIRMVRCCRFAAKLEFKIEENTLIAIKNNASNISKIAIERVMQEIYKAAGSEGYKFANFINLLDETGLLIYILPEIYKLKELKQSEKHHPESSNVFGHIIEALKTVKEKNVLLNLCVLFHDCGKIKTYSLDENGVPHYYKHELESDEIIDNIALRLKMDNSTKDSIKFVCRYHMMMHQFCNLNKSTAMSLIEHKDWNVLLNASKADSECRGNVHVGEWKRIEQRILELKSWFKDKQAIDSIRKIVNGNFVMKLRSEIKPSPKLGKIIKETVDWILNENINIDDTDKIISYILNWKEI
jgi:tRNA nucleotidyltransferase (CCA-adding enzyme)